MLGRLEWLRGALARSSSSDAPMGMSTRPLLRHKTMALLDNDTHGALVEGSTGCRIFETRSTIST